MKRIVNIAVFTVAITVGATSLFAQNYKIKQSTSMTSMSGHKIESTVYVKGSRKRTEQGAMMGMGGDVATIEQCDLKRTVQVNDKKKLYYVQSTTVSDSSPTPAKASVTPGKVTKGGTVTMISNITDTGERKQMFGLTARHLKTSMTMQSSPDACSQQNMKIETDGWYVDLPMFACPFNPTERQITTPRSAPHGCEDHYVTKSTGGGKLGFALQFTQTMITPGRDEAFSTTLETIEFSKATLDDALFNVPADYKLANDSQALYGTPDYSAMMKGAGNNDDEDKPSSMMNPAQPMAGAKKPGVKRIGVLVPGNRTSEMVSTTSLQQFLTQKLTGGNVEAIAVSSEADAKAMNCDYLLSSDISKLKQSTASKIGGMFGKVTNTDTSGTQNFDTQVDFKLTSLASGQSVLQSKAAAKVAGSAETAAQNVLSQEASAVLGAAK